MSLETVLMFVGIVISGLLIVQLTAFTGRSLVAFWGSHRQYRLTHELLQARIIAAKRSLVFNDLSSAAWEGYRKFRVKWKVREASRCYSFYLVPHDGKPLPPYRPGQFLTLGVKLGGTSRRVIRCYSLSDSPRQDYYRITVKKLVPADPSIPPGRVSSYLVDSVVEGDILDVKAPMGRFVLDTDSDVPVVFLAGGIGLTPLLSMLAYLVETQPQRRAYFLLGVRNSAEHPFREYLSRIAEGNENITLHTRYSAPLPQDIGHNSVGHIDIDLLREVLPTLRLRYYVCGPADFQKCLTNQLRIAGIPDELVQTEAFGAASAKNSLPDQAKSATASKGLKVQFARSQSTVTWDEKYETLLELAEAHGVAIESGCRAGNCGTCLTAIKSGSVRHRGGVVADDGTCLACVAVPEGNIVLDA